MPRRKRRAVAGTSHSDSDSEEEGPNWGNCRFLSHVRRSWQEPLYKQKIEGVKNPYCFERIVDLADWEAYGVIEPFRRLGWMAALQPLPCKIYDKPQDAVVYLGRVVDWMATLERIEGVNPPATTTLVGTVGDRQVSLSLDTFNELAGENYFDSGPTNNETYTLTTAYRLFEYGPGTEGWISMLSDLFCPPRPGCDFSMMREDLLPLPRALSHIMFYNILPRRSDMNAMRNYEIPLLHSLVTGSPVYSLRQVMMLHIWECRDSRDHSAIIPYTRFLSAFIRHSCDISGEMGRHEKLAKIRTSIKGLYFSARGGIGSMQDLKRGLSYEFREEEEEEEEREKGREEEEDRDVGTEGGDMDTDMGFRAEYDTGAGSRDWSSSEQMRHNARMEDIWREQQRISEMMARQEARDQRLADAARAQWYMQEYYEHRRQEYFDGVRAYHLHPAPTPQDYPYYSPPVFCPPPPPAPGHESSSFSATSGDPWDMAPMAQTLFESVFGPPPPRPPST